MIDREGFRSNVGIIISNQEGQLLWAKRANQKAWQFPQGGVNQGESAEQTLFRELYEEVGLKRKDVKIIGSTQQWLKYHLPQRLIRRDSKPLCIGQKQKWFLLRLISNENAIRFDRDASPEFDDWMWVSYWYPLRYVVSFKREVYREALQELAPLLAHEVQARQSGHKNHHRRRKPRRT